MDETVEQHTELFTKSELSNPAELIKQWMDKLGVRITDVEYSFVTRMQNSAYGVALVESIGGNEGDGEFTSKVFAFGTKGKNASILFYFRFTGFHSSYEGVQWDDDFEIVEPREVTRTEYFAV